LPSARTIPMYAFYTGLVAVATLIFTIYVPATRGYFNVGESAVFTVALLAGGRAGAFAGGVGSMISDMLLGYYLFAPATLVIKGVEGGVLGLLASRQPRLTVGTWRLLSVLVGAGIFLTVFLLGSAYYTGETSITLGLPWLASSSFTAVIPQAFWAAAGLASAGIVVAIAFLNKPEVGYITICAAASGLLMVLGYFLFEQFILGYVAIAEVPFNIGQMLIGIVIAIPAYNSLKALKRTSA